MASDKRTQRVVLQNSKSEASHVVVEEIKSRVSDSPVQEKIVTGTQVAGKAETLQVQELVNGVENEVQVQGKPLRTTTVTLTGSASGQPITTTVTGSKSGSSAETIIIKSASGDESIQPAYYVYESDVFKDLKLGTDAFAQAAVKGKRITELRDVKPDHIQAIHVLKNKMAVAAFGEDGKNGAVLITLKEGTYTPKSAEKTEEFIVYPVPTDRFVKVKFYLDKRQHVKADALDFNGAKVKSLTDQVLDKGWHELEWDASLQPAGTYIITLSKESGVANKRVLLK